MSDSAISQRTPESMPDRRRFMGCAAVAAAAAVSAIGLNGESHAQTTAGESGSGTPPPCPIPPTSAKRGVWVKRADPCQPDSGWQAV